MPIPPTPPGAPPPPDGVPPPTGGAPTDGVLGVGVLGTDTLGVEGVLGTVTLGVEGTLGTVTLGTEGTLGAVIVGRRSGTVPGGRTWFTTGNRVSWAIGCVGGLRTLAGLRTLVLPAVACGATFVPLVPTGPMDAFSRRS